MAGRVSLWRYREHADDYPGFHLSADRPGCGQLITLFASFMKLRSPQIANIVLDPVTSDVLAVPNRRNATIHIYRNWELVADPSFPPERLHFTVMHDRVRTEMSVIQMEGIVAGLEDMRERRGGYAIGDDGTEQQLWFWWQEAV